MATSNRRDSTGNKMDAARSGESQAQTSSAEDAQRAETPEQALEGAGADERQFFEGSVVKINRDGNEVMSDHLAPGEKLRRTTTDAYATEKREERREASAEQERRDSDKDNQSN